MLGEPSPAVWTYDSATLQNGDSGLSPVCFYLKNLPRTLFLDDGLCSRSATRSLTPSCLRAVKGMVGRIFFLVPLCVEIAIPFFALAHFESRFLFQPNRSGDGE